MFEQINLRDPLDILCQTFVHTSCPRTGQTEGTIQYIHLSHCYLRLIQQPLHFTPSSIIFGIYDSQRLCQYRVVLWIIIQRSLHINNVKMVKNFDSLWVNYQRKTSVQTTILFPHGNNIDQSSNIYIYISSFSMFRKYKLLTL